MKITDTEPPSTVHSHKTKQKRPQLWPLPPHDYRTASRRFMAALAELAAAVGRTPRQVRTALQSASAKTAAKCRYSGVGRLAITSRPTRA
jgi:hypothetical protein